MKEIMKTSVKKAVATNFKDIEKIKEFIGLIFGDFIKQLEFPIIFNYTIEAKEYKEKEKIKK